MLSLKIIKEKIALLEKSYYKNWYYGEENGYKGIFTKNDEGVIELFIISMDGKRPSFLATGIANDAIGEAKPIIESLLEGVEENDRVKEIISRHQATTKGLWRSDNFSAFMTEDHKHLIYCKKNEVVFKNPADLEFLLHYVDDAKYLISLHSAYASKIVYY